MCHTLRKASGVLYLSRKDWYHM